MYKVYGTATSKMVNMLILEILKDYSDENHSLTQQDIIRKLKDDYGMENVDRRTVKANVQSLKDMGYDIYIEDGQPYYLISRDFDDAELRILIDSVLFSKTLTNEQATQLIAKLEGLGNKYFESKVSHVCPTPDLGRTENKQVMYNVGFLNDAIEQKKKISFRYCKYNSSLELKDNGEYIANPYQMVASNGHYYLLANIDKYDNISYYRIDKIKDVKILDENVKSQKKVKGLEKQLDLSKHMAEHIYMFCGESAMIKFKIAPGMVDTLVDWFGKDFKILDKKDDALTIRVKCNLNAMYYWAIQYGTSVEILEPESLRNEVAQATETMYKKYH